MGATFIGKNNGIQIKKEHFLCNLIYDCAIAIVNPLALKWNKLVNWNALEKHIKL